MRGRARTLTGSRERVRWISGAKLRSSSVAEHTPIAAVAAAGASET